MLIMSPQAWAQTGSEHFDPEVDPAEYITRYIQEEQYAAWYDEYYPDVALYDTLGITEEQYNEIVQSLETSDTCQPGTVMRDGECVPSKTETTGGIQSAPRGTGLQMGVGAVGAFALALGVILVLWLPGRIRRWHAQHS